MQLKTLAALMPLLLWGCEPYLAVSPELGNDNDTVQTQTVPTVSTGNSNATVNDTLPSSNTGGQGSLDGEAAEHLPTSVVVSGEGGSAAPQVPSAEQAVGDAFDRGFNTLAGKCYAYGRTLGNAQLNFFKYCAGHVLYDTDPIGNGVWVSAAFRIGLNSPAGRPAVSAPEPVVPPNTDIVIVGTPPEAPTAPVPDVQPTPTNPTTPDTNGPVVDAGEPLVVLHYDSAPDMDDLTAMIMARVVFDKLGYEPALAVNAACGYQQCHRVIPGSTEHMLTMFPNGLDARSELPAVLAKWRVMLSTGRPIMVAEGGPSTHTAKVFRALLAEGYDLHNVTVVQHSHGWNEDQTKPSDIQLIENVSKYVRIGNGNIGSHGAAKLNHAYRSAQCKAWENGNPYPSQRDWAQRILGTAKCDGSDTVELLYILGDKTTTDFITFARKYF